MCCRKLRRVPVENDKLKRLTRRRRQLVGEKGRVLNRLQADLQAVCPGLLAITGEADNLWFLSLLAMPGGSAQDRGAAQEHAAEPGGGGQQVRLGDPGVADAKPCSRRRLSG